MRRWSALHLGGEPLGHVGVLGDHVEHDLAGRPHLVHLADHLAHEVVGQLLGAGSRQDIRAFGTNAALNLLRLWLLEERRR